MTPRCEHDARMSTQCMRDGRWFLFRDHRMPAPGPFCEEHARARLSKYPGSVLADAPPEPPVDFGCPYCGGPLGGSPHGCCHLCAADLEASRYYTR
jgi:hypothetical protein